MASKSGILRGVGTAWCSAVFILVMLGFFGIVFTDGFGAAIKTFSPFNFWNTGVILFLLAPGFILLALADRSN